MSAPEQYVFRITHKGTHFYFESIDGGEDQEVEFTANLEKAFKFTKESMAKFRREESHIRGRVVLLSTAQKGRP